MRIAYLTTDEVNLRLAQAIAGDYGLTVCPLDPRDPPPDGEFDAVLYDWDYWPAPRHCEVLTELRAGRLPDAMAVHGYNLGADQAEALRRHTVGVYRRLQPRVFRSLSRAARAVRAAKASGRNRV
jgi:hypothetical protein